MFLKLFATCGKYIFLLYDLTHTLKQKMLQNNTYILLVSMYSNILFTFFWNILFHFILLKCWYWNQWISFLTHQWNITHFNKHCPGELNQRHRCPSSAVRRGNPAAGEQHMSWVMGVCTCPCPEPHCTTLAHAKGRAILNSKYENPWQAERETVEERKL